MTEDAASHHMAPVSRAGEAQTAPLHVRPLVHWFARLMDVTLDLKAGKTDWRLRRHADLMKHLQQGVDELSAVLSYHTRRGGADADWSECGHDPVLNAAGVACRALMLADAFRLERAVTADRAASEIKSGIPANGTAAKIVTEEPLFEFLNGEIQPGEFALAMVRLVRYETNARGLVVAIGDGHQEAIDVAHYALAARELCLANRTPIQVTGTEVHYLVTDVQYGCIQPVQRRKLAPEKIERAFRRAQRELGTNWKLKGRGHCSRATVPAHVSAPAARGAKRSWVFLSAGVGGYRRLFPLAIIRRAARLLKIPAAELIGRDLTGRSY